MKMINTWSRLLTGFHFNPLGIIIIIMITSLSETSKVKYNKELGKLHTYSAPGYMINEFLISSISYILIRLILQMYSDFVTRIDHNLL